MSALATAVYRGRQRIAAPDPADRGLAYGDGLFETVLVFAHQAVWWPAHWARLARGAAALGFGLPQREWLEAELGPLLSSAPDNSVLKLILTRGAGGRGYAADPELEPTLVLSVHAAPPQPAGPLVLRWCDTRLAIQPALAGIKHLNRLEQVLARAECSETGFDEGLVCDHDGHVVAATGANLFVFREGRWLTPGLDRCGIAGVCRAQLLLPLQAREARLDRAAIESADAVFLSNAVRGILPVARLGTRAWPPHPAIAAARAVLARLHPAFALDLEHP